MKSLKFDHELVPFIISGEKTTTWRFNDDKDLSVDDRVQFIDKVDPDDPKTWQIFGEATIDQVTQKRLGDIDPKDTGGHESYESVEEMLSAFRGRYGDAVDDGHARMKIIDYTFRPYSQPESLSEVEAENTTHITEVKVYADGGSRGNPGPSASGFAVLDMADNVLKKHGVYLGKTTNNQAEYEALRLGLEAAQKFGARHVDVYMDSQLVVNQMLGTYKVRKPELMPVHESIKRLVAQFDKVTFTHVPRELNKLADRMVNEALDAELTK